MLKINFLCNNLVSSVHVEFARGQTRGRGGRYGGRYFAGSRYSSRNGSYAEK